MVKTFALITLMGFHVAADLPDDEVAQLQHVRLNANDHLLTDPSDDEPPVDGEEPDDEPPVDDASVQLLETSLDGADYKTTTPGSTDCPAGYAAVSTEAECQTAAQAPNRWLMAGSWSYIQAGCFRYSDGRTWFNHNSAGQPTYSVKFSTVCVKSGPDCGGPIKYPVEGRLLGNIPGGHWKNFGSKRNDAGAFIPIQDCLDACQNYVPPAGSSATCKSVSGHPMKGDPTRMWCNLHGEIPASSSNWEVRPGWVAYTMCNAIYPDCGAPIEYPVEGRLLGNIPGGHWKNFGSKRNDAGAFIPFQDCLAACRNYVPPAGSSATCKSFSGHPMKGDPTRMWCNLHNEIPASSSNWEVRPGWKAYTMCNAFHLNTPGKTQCASGNPVSKDECEGAVQMLASANNRTPGRPMQEGRGGGCMDGSWGQVPAGCSAQTGVGGDWAAHYKDGAGLSDACVSDVYQMVCA